jgi:hypothetical protein
VLALPSCSRCGSLSLPPGQVCPNCGSTDPEYAYQEVSGQGTVRSWTVVRQSFLPGFDADLPFMLVDVELTVPGGSAQPEVRLIGRLLDGPDAPVRPGAPVTVAFEDIRTDTERVSLPAFTLTVSPERGNQ